MFGELPKNIYYVTEILAHFWKGGDSKKGGIFTKRDKASWETLYGDIVRKLVLMYFLSFTYFGKCFKLTFPLDWHTNTTELIMKYCTNATAKPYLHRKIKNVTLKLSYSKTRRWQTNVVCSENSCGVLWQAQEHFAIFVRI